MSPKLIIILAISFSFPFIIGTDPPDPWILRPLPINVDSFATIKEGGYIYVDKTAIILKLIKSGRKFNFLARPEGFGKSLLLSTMYEIFRGHKELFKDTKIYESDYEWTTYPVVKIDFFKLNCDSPTRLKNSLMKSLREVANSYGISTLRSRDVTDCIKSLIEGLRRKFSKKVVFLIDEYDHAYLKNFNPQQNADKVHAVLQDFYSSLLNMSRAIEFCFTAHVNYISSVTYDNRFCDHGKYDISRKLGYAHLTGFTHEEVKIYFRDHIKAIVEHRNITIKEVYKEISSWYYGYWFRSGDDLPYMEPTSSRPISGVQFYNSYSILKYLQSKEAGIFWSELHSSTVNSLLQEFIEREPWNSLIYLQSSDEYRDENDEGEIWNENLHWLYDLTDLNFYGRENNQKTFGDQGSSLALNKFMLERGYFVKTHQGEMLSSTEYMDFANREVKEIFCNILTKFFLGVQPQKFIEIALVMKKRLREVKIDEFIVNMNTFLSMLPPFPFPATREMRNNSTDMSKLRKEMFRLNFHGALMVARLFNNYEYFKISQRDDPLRGCAANCPLYIFYLRTSEENGVRECSWGDKLPPGNHPTGAVCLDITFDAESRQIIVWNATTIGRTELEQTIKNNRWKDFFRV